jgi:hypothetical protein
MGRKKRVGIAVAVAAAGALAASLLVAATSGLPSAVAARSTFSGDNHGAGRARRSARSAQGKQTFRFDTFGDQAFWGDTLHLNQAIAGAANGGVGPGVSPKTALSVGLKVDVDALPARSARPSPTARSTLTTRPSR